MPAEMSYEPDRQDELMADAEAAGGHAFVREVSYAATELTALDYPWSGDGEDEAPGYREAWLAHAERLITRRRAELKRGANGIE